MTFNAARAHWKQTHINICFNLNIFLLSALFLLERAMNVLPLSLFVFLRARWISSRCKIASNCDIFVLLSLLLSAGISRSLRRPSTRPINVLLWGRSDVTCVSDEQLRWLHGLKAFQCQARARDTPTELKTILRYTLFKWKSNNLWCVIR